MDLHNSSRNLKLELRRLENSDICEENKALLKKFARDLKAEGISDLRIQRYLSILRKVLEWNDRVLSEWDEEDLKEVLFEIENNGYSPQTVNEFRKTLRKFFRWIHGDEWKGLKILRGGKKDKRQPDILTEEEIERMIEAALNERDKAIIAVGYEAGLRIGELASLRWKNVLWTDEGARIKVSGKTGERTILIVASASYLRSWMTAHPAYDPERGKVDPEALVFVRINGKDRGKPMSYRMFAKALKKAAERAEIRKRVYPHILRHSRATVLANFLTEAQMCKYFGWVMGSDMPRIYVHLSGRDVDDAIREVYGLEPERKKRLAPRRCPRCNELNLPSAQFCNRCGLILDEEKRLKLQFKENEVTAASVSEILKDPEMVSSLLKIAEFFERNPRILKRLTEEIDG